MTDETAFDIVVSLASENLLDVKDCDGDDGMLGMRKDQLAALEQVEAFLMKNLHPTQCSGCRCSPHTPVIFPKGDAG